MTFEYPLHWTPKHIEQLAADPAWDQIAFDEAVSPSVLRALDKLILAKRPEFQVCFYGFLDDALDSHCLELIPSVRRLSIRGIAEAQTPFVLPAYQHLTELTIGILNLEDFTFLEALPPPLARLSLELTTRQKISLAPIERFRDLKRLSLEGHTKDIEVIGTLRKLEELRLRSITIDSLAWITSLPHLWSFDLKLGGTRELSALGQVKKLKYLEIWQVHQFKELAFLAECLALQFLYLQSLPKVTEFPSLAMLKHLRRIYLENMKGLRTLAPIAAAPALEEFNFAAATHLQPKDFSPFLKHPTLKRAAVGFGSQKRNAELEAQLADAGIAPQTTPLHTFSFR
jgi:hypothetical protein